MSARKQTVFNVQGMTCSSCVRHVDGALRELSGVHSVEVRLREGKVLVTHEAQEPSEEVMVRALHDAGYEATLDPTPQVSSALVCSAHG